MSGGFCVDRAIIVWNGNPLYDGFWEFVSKIWRTNFGIIPTLIFVGEPPKGLCKQYGEIHVLPEVKDVIVNPNRDWAVTWALFYGASMFPDDVCMTHGVDQVPLSDKFLLDMESYNFAGGEYVVGLVDAYQNANWHVSSNHVAKGSTYKTALQINDNWEEEVRKVFKFKDRYGPMYGGGDYWGLEEVHSSHLLQSYDKKLLKEHKGFEDFHSRILDTKNEIPDLECLKRGGYSELLTDRPLNLLSDEVLMDISDNIPKYIS